MSDTPPPLTPEPTHQPPLAGTAAPPESGSGKKSAACCGIGCLTVVVLGIVLTIVGVNVAKNKLGDWAEEYTSAEAVQIAIPQISEEEVADATTRYDDFKAAVAAGTAAEPLVLSENGLNAILLNHPDFSGLSKSAVASIQNNLLSIQSSFNLDSLNIPFDFIAERVKGKYFNGDITVRFGDAGGRPSMYLENVAVGEKEIPREVIEGMKSEDLLEQTASNPEAKEFFDKIKAIRIENDQLIIVPTGAP